MPILVDVPFGMCARKFLASGALKPLSQRTEIYVLSPFGDDPAFQAQFPWVRHLSPRSLQLRWHSGARRLARAAHRVVDAYERRELAGRTNNRSFQMQLELELRQDFLRYLVNEAIYRLLLNERLRTSLERLRSWAETPASIAGLPRIDAAFFTHAYYETVAGLRRHCAAAAVPMAAYVHSWDNANTRGVLPARYDRLLIWNTQMRETLLDMYPSYRPEQLAIVGSPAFDSYLQPNGTLGRDELRRLVGASGAERLIALVLGSPTIYSNQDEWLRRTLAWIDEGRFGRVRLVVRFESNFVGRSEFYGYRRRIEALLADRKDVHMSYPTVADASGTPFSGWSPGREDLFLPSLLRHADLVVNTASTTSIQAALFDTPVVSLAFHHATEDTSTLGSYEVMAFHQSHYADLVVRSKATYLARSYDELLHKMLEALSKPERKREERARLVEWVCGHDHRAADIVAEELLGLLGEPGNSILEPIPAVAKEVA